MNVLITGSCGFIGFHLGKRLLKEGHSIIGIDNMSNYYDTRIKNIRLKILKKYKRFKFVKLDLSKKNLKLSNTIKKIDYIVNLAAQAGVKYSLKDPLAYYQNNIVAFAYILELAKDLKVKKLIYASSSSVYGDVKNKFFVEHKIGNPLSNYSLTKRMNELMADFYSKIFSVTCVGLRFFNVYGPYGRPDMALWIFLKNALLNREVKLHNYGKMERSFTYIDDIINSICLIMEIKDKKNHKKNVIFNIGNSNTIKLFSLVKIIEKKINKKIRYKKISIQFGEIKKTHASNEKFNKIYNFKPKVKVTDGVNKFIDWYLDYKKKYKWL